MTVNGSDTYERPFGPNAPWNIPVDRLTTDPNSSHLVSMLWNNGPASRPGNFNLNFSSYTYPVFDARNATGLYTVDTTWSTNIDGKQIPWNPAWKPAPGTDGQVIVVDPATGREWDLWQVSFNGSTVHATNGSLVPGNIATYEGGNSPSRGIGIEYLAMLVRPEEIAQGHIDHALSLPSRFTDKDTSVAPATKVEGSSGSVPDGIPIGTRFALNVTDAQINQWIASLPSTLSPETIRSARIIAEALREYGWFITDTSGAAEFQFESNTTAASDWASLGLSPRTAGSATYPQDLLDGLMQQGRISAVAPSNMYPSAAFAVKSAVSATLAAGQSHLALTGAANVDGTGNAASNDIRGNSGNNVLSGLGGNDDLFGGLGNDTLIGGTGNDSLRGGMGADRFVMSKGGGQDTILDFAAGSGVNDVAVLDGYALTSFAQVKAAMVQSGANVVLNLGGGDTLTFKNHVISDFVADDFGFTGASTSPTQPTLFTLPESGASTSTITGTTGNDTLNGTGANETIGGRAGTDTMTGGGGNDIYNVDNPGDKVVESAGQGIDTVQCWAGSYTLADNVENLGLQGTWVHTVAANGLNNLITLSDAGDTVNAGTGNDIIRSGAGADTMTGGAGTDIFALAGSKADVITDFHSGEDRLDLRSFTKAAGYTGTNPFSDGHILIVQNGTNTTISFDADGKAGAAAAQLVVTLNGVTSSILGIQQDIAWS